MASFSIPLTGLEADSTALNTIANDLSNMNTTAFKAQTTNFSDLFYQQVGETGIGRPDPGGRGHAGGLQLDRLHARVIQHKRHEHLGYGH